MRVKAPPRNKYRKLKNRRHERLAKNIIARDGDIKKAYVDTYPNASIASAQNRAYVVLTQHPEVKGRMSQMLEVQGLGEMVLNEKLKDVIGSSDEATSLSGLKTAYKLHGHLQSGININLDQREQTVNIREESEEGGKNITHALDQLKSMNKGISDEKSNAIGEVKTEDAIIIDEEPR